MLMGSVITRAPNNDNVQQRLSRPAPYHFAYGVSSQPDLVRYGHREESNGNIVKGAYSIALPDGRTQTVQYEADPIRGYTAKVTYEATPGYIQPPTSTQDSLASATTQYSQLPIVQMERSAHKPHPSSSKPRTRAQHPHVQQAQSSHLVPTHSLLLPDAIKRKTVTSTTTLQPRHVTVHKAVVTQIPHKHRELTASAAVHSMFSLPWHKLLRVPQSETGVPFEQHNATIPKKLSIVLR
ncbi:unnamed protein product [Meganyctiphanes norvegica]|uniref:Cuticle protein n=1 Tax=Meganyctiphanes norvegica TaxID=48144 RepID=A0AAV2PIS0_MEGNR